MRYHEIIREDHSFDGNQQLLWYFRVRPVFVQDHDEWFDDVWTHYRDTELDDPDALYSELDDEGMREFSDWMVAYGHVREWVYNDPHGAPAWALMDPVGPLSPQTWLIHFCKDAERIKREGFRMGVPDVDKIALTRINSVYGGPAERIRYGEPGYNFAYMADGSVMLTQRWNPEGYGRQVLLFQSAGMLVHHNGDREEQAVFWGPSANLQTAHVIKATRYGFVSGDVKAKTLEELVELLTRGS